VFVGLFGSTPLWTSADLALTMVWVVGITAAFSILDHMDGLVAGVASIAAAFFLAMSLAGGQLLVATLAAAVLGAPSDFSGGISIPRGSSWADGGAMFLGFMMATLGLKLHAGAASLNAAFVPVFVLAVPIFDTSLVVISRTRRGLLPFASPGKDHTSHRLTVLGLDHRRAVLAMYGAGLTGGAIAMVLSRVAVPTAVVVVGAAIVVALTAIVGLERCAFERQ